MEKLEMHRGLVFLVLCFFHFWMLWQASERGWNDRWSNLIAGIVGILSTAWFLTQYYEPAMRNPSAGNFSFLMWTAMMLGLMLATATPLAMLLPAEEKV